MRIPIILMATVLTACGGQIADQYPHPAHHMEQK